MVLRENKFVKIRTMNQEKLEEMKNRLEEKRKSVVEGLESFARENKEIKDDFETKFPHLGDHMDENALEVSDYENKLSVEHNLENDLKKIDRALEKIENGSYGLCEKCGGEINPERIEALPEAVECMKCVK